MPVEYPTVHLSTSRDLSAAAAEGRGETRGEMTAYLSRFARQVPHPADRLRPI